MIDRTAFQFTVDSLGPGVLGVEYVGYLGEALVAPVEAIIKHIEQSPTPLSIVYKLDKLTGFHRSQVTIYGQFYVKYSSRMKATALVGASASAHFAAITVGLMSKINIRSFPDHPTALEWLASLNRVERRA